MQFGTLFELCKASQYYNIKKLCTCIKLKKLLLFQVPLCFPYSDFRCFSMVPNSFSLGTEELQSWNYHFALPYRSFLCVYFYTVLSQDQYLKNEIRKRIPKQEGYIFVCMIMFNQNSSERIILGQNKSLGLIWILKWYCFFPCFFYISTLRYQLASYLNKLDVKNTNNLCFKWISRKSCHHNTISNYSLNGRRTFERNCKFL